MADYHLSVFAVGRKSDIYISCVSYTHQVSAKGWFIAMISTTVETDNPEAEIQPGLNLLGPIKQKFLEVRKYFEFINNILNSQHFPSPAGD